MGPTNVHNTTTSQSCSVRVFERRGEEWGVTWTELPFDYIALPISKFNARISFVRP